MLVACFFIFTVITLSSCVYAEDDISTCSTVTTDINVDDTPTSGTSGCSTATSTGTVSKAASGPVKGYYMRYDDVAGASKDDLLAKGITDVYILTRGSDGKTHNAELLAAISKFSPDIRVHAWIVCFKTSSGFVDPSGYYSYTKKVYVKTIKTWGKKKVAYRVWKKVKWKKVNGKWKYKWKKVTKYRWKKCWIYTPVYQYITVKGYDSTYNNNLLSYIQSTSNYANLYGIHLDYIRYSGVTSLNHAAWQEPGGETAAVNAVTSFVQKVRSGMKTSAVLSAALMPEGATNAHTYGQDYSRLADYLDFLVPMTYEGNYNANNDWITSATNYIVTLAKGKPVYPVLTTYWSDSNTRVLTSAELDADAQAAKDGGASGFILFRYGIGSYVPTLIF